MVSSYSTLGVNVPCAGGKPVAQGFLYPTEINCKDNELVKIQIITTAQACGNSELVPIEYSLDWGDGSTPTSGTFVKGSVANVELSHTYRYEPGTQYQSTKYLPKATIKTGCGGIRTFGGVIGECVVYVFRADVDISGQGFTMASYRLHSDFNTNECGSGRVPSCSGSEQVCMGGTLLICNDGDWVPQMGSCIDPNGVVTSGLDPSYWTSVLTTPAPTYTGELTPSVIDASPTDFIGETIGRITTIVNDNKILAIGGLALLGGFMLFGGRKRR